MSDLLTCPEALAVVTVQIRLIAQARTSTTETAPLKDAQGRVLAEDIRADRDQPPFARSTRDGYAVFAAHNGDRKIMGLLRAGEIWSGPALQPSEAIEIMTGAPIPPGADAVAMVEFVAVDGETLRCQRSVSPAENIVSQGAEARQNDVILSRGTRLRAAEIALCASLGYAQVVVHPQPRVAVIATGDELVAVSATPQPFQIRNSNTYGLGALITQYGGIPVLLPPASDTAQSLRAALDAAGDVDLVLLSGGVSAGKYDLVEPALLARGAEFFFTGVRMQPGKPVVFGHFPAEKKYLFGLPGNPVSTQVTFLLLAAPLLRALGGETDPAPHFAQATLAQAVSAMARTTRLLPARLEQTLTEAMVTLIAWQGSGDLAANARANCYAVLQPETTYAAGDTITVLLR